MQDQIKSLILESDWISKERKAALSFLARTIEHQIEENGTAKVTFVCTHNSRRSQLAQLWLYMGCQYYDLDRIMAFSAGTEATSFNIRMVEAVKKFGFTLEESGADRGPANPEYILKAGGGSKEGIIMFSKVLDNPFNPQDLFIAVMVCSHADENCPFVPGTFARISLPFEDPKTYDDTPDEIKAYDDKVREIGREILYVTRMIKMPN